MSTQTPPENLTTDSYKQLRIIPLPDGTIHRLPEIISSSPIPHRPVPVLTKDITINQSNNTWARIFLPQQSLDYTSSHPKLPLIVWFHGGGFILCSAASTIWHDSCVNLAIELASIVVSIEYRLAPEHRLPAAYEDAVEALYWIKSSPDEWFRVFADLSNCFLMGNSAGANIAYRAGLRVAETVEDLDPLKIKGLILSQPFFGGSKRTESELRMVNDPILPLCSSDLMWDLALPIGADRDHEYCNPTVLEGDSKALIKMRELGWRIFVHWGDGDLLMDRQGELVKILREKGIIVESHFVEGHCHGVEVVEPSKYKAMYVAYKSFISSSVLA